MTSQPISPRYRWLSMPLGSGIWRNWLTDTGSLTQRLQRSHPRFAVQPVFSKRARICVDERHALGVAADRNAVCRDVYLLWGDTPVVYAHSVLPIRSLRGEWQALSHLGNRSLGSALFSNPQVTRTALTYNKLHPHHALFRAAVAHLDKKPTYLWARRSVFRLRRAGILVTEIFLPELMHR